MQPNPHKIIITIRGGACFTATTPHVYNVPNESCATTIGIAWAHHLVIGKVSKLMSGHF